MDKKAYHQETFDEDEIYGQDALAITRTHLSNERTLLAYLRTFLGFITAGVAMIQFVKNSYFVVIGYGLLSFSISIVIIGLYRFIKNRSIIMKEAFYQQHLEQNSEEKNRKNG